MNQPLTYDVFIECDPSTAFDLLADLRNEKRWSKGVTSAEARDEGPVREGSKFMTLYRGMESQSTLAEFDRPGRLTVASITDRIDFDTAYTLTGANGGTNVAISLDATAQGSRRGLLSSAPNVHAT